MPRLAQRYERRNCCRPTSGLFGYKARGSRQRNKLLGIKFGSCDRPRFEMIRHALRGSEEFFRLTSAIADAR